MSQHHPTPVEDYTTPFLVMFFVLVFMGLFTLWAVFGYMASLVTSYVLHLLIGRLPRRS